MTSGVTIGRRLDRWLDEWKMALSGMILATRDPKFLLTFALTFVIFGTLMTLLAGSTAAFSLFWTTDFSGKLAIIRDGFLGVFGVGRNFWDWLLTFAITLLQSILIGLVVLVWRKRHHAKKAESTKSHASAIKKTESTKTSTYTTGKTKSANPDNSTAKNSDNLQNAGLAAGLAVLGSGCPTCGTTLLAPVLGAIFSSGSYALASTISGLLTAAAILLALFTLKRIGKDAFVLITSEEFCKRHAKPTAKFANIAKPTNTTSATKPASTADQKPAKPTKPTESTKANKPNQEEKSHV